MVKLEHFSILLEICMMKSLKPHAFGYDISQEMEKRIYFIGVLPYERIFTFSLYVALV